MIINKCVQAAVKAHHREDGSILVNTEIALPAVIHSIPARLAHWACTTPAATFISEGEQALTYAEVEVIRSQLSAHLLSLPVSGEHPLLILGDNGINHALVMLAATAVGIPVAVASPAYATPAAAPWDKLKRVISQVGPGCILADSVGAEVAAGCAPEDILVFPLHDLSWLMERRPVDAAQVKAAENSVTDETVAKLLFTSGSTGLPKAVINTQRMMTTNMNALSAIWPFLVERPPVLVDWLPWNHTFGGNFCFNIALWFGGHLHIDKGRPTEALIEKTIAAIRKYKPTIYFNVPMGYGLLATYCEGDKAFAEEFFGRLDFLFNAGAAMPDSIRKQLEAVALAATSKRAHLFGGWGSTETAPFATALCFETDYAGNLGVPIPGTTIKMVPDRDRYELLIKGPNVTPGYWRNAEATAAAFDEEGFYRIGDAGKLADPENPAAGILFDGRVAENFKLSSGTFVNVGKLRLAVISAGEKLISDVVVAGEGRDEVGLLLFLNEQACRSLIDEGELKVDAPLIRQPAVLNRLSMLLRSYNSTATGTSSRIARFIVAEELPSAAHDEITDKGYINQRRVLARRSTLVAQLFESGIPL